MKILVTGGAGYIGSHTVLSLLEAGHSVVSVDNYDNSKPEALRRVAELAGLPPAVGDAPSGGVVYGPRLSVYELDALNEAGLNAVFKEHAVDAVIHFAGLKAVGESVREPLRYYEVNVGSTLSLLRAMERAGCRKLVFSSSCTVYGTPESLPIVEASKLGAESPYGRTKLMIEDMLRDLAASQVHVAHPKDAWGRARTGAGGAWKIALLRYFNPVGAHSSGCIGEDPNGVPNNLLPYITQVAVGRLKELSVYGSDYPTKDGTGVRDYLHVVDLAEGHVKAVEAVNVEPVASTGSIGAWKGAVAINLGTGRGYTVLEVVKAFEQVSGKKVPYKLVPRRPGDVAAVYAHPAQAEALLGWRAKFDILEMCRDSWAWQQKNPAGYG